MFVKPSNSGSSVGVKKATNDQELKMAIENAGQYDTKIFKKFYDEKNIITENYSNFLNLNLWELIKDFVKYIDETS